MNRPLLLTPSLKTVTVEQSAVTPLGWTVAPVQAADTAGQFSGVPLGHHDSAGAHTAKQFGSASGKEIGLGATTSSRRRADIAVDEAGDVRDWAQRLVEHMDASLADGVFDSTEAQKAREIGRRIAQEAEESVVVSEWVDAGELQALSKLLGRDSARAAMREHQVRLRAMEIGLSLAGTT